MEIEAPEEFDLPQSPTPLEELNSPVNPEAETPVETAEPENNAAEENPADNQFGGNYNNHTNQPLRRSARIPNARPRELYPGSVKYV